jgi:parallel beta-helix repeat protein
MHFHGNHIHHTSGHGEAFYLGGNNDSEGKTVTVFRNSIVETNYIHHLDGPDISQGDGIEVKDGRDGNMIRNNVIHDTKYPGVTLYGTDGNERNVVEGNVIWNTGDNGIQVAADARVLRNIIMDAGGDGIRSKQQSARVGNLDILENTILKENGVGIRVDVEANVSGPIAIRGNIITAPEAFRIAKNAQVSIEENEVKPASSNVDRLRVKEQALRRLGRETELK